MYRRLAWLVGWGLCLLATHVWAQAPGERSTQPGLVNYPTSPPTIRTVSKVDAEAGVVEMEVQYLVYVPVAVTRLVIEDGVKRTVTETKVVPETRVSKLVFSLDKGKAHTADGTEIDRKKLAEKVKVGMFVVVPTDGNGQLSKGFAKMFKDDTVLLLAPFPQPESREPPKP